MGDLLYEALSQNESFNRVLRSSPAWVFVPIPLHSSKYRARGYNQSEILAKELGKRLNIKTFELLKRVKDTKSQYGLKVKDRKENIKGAFAINSSLITHKQSLRSDDLNLELKNTGVFLVDDIVTTGSTLLEAANILKRNGAKRVYGITLARD